MENIKYWETHLKNVIEIIESNLNNRTAVKIGLYCRWISCPRKDCNNKQIQNKKWDCSFGEGHIENAEKCIECYNLYQGGSKLRELNEWNITYTEEIAEPTKYNIYRATKERLENEWDEKRIESIKSFFHGIELKSVIDYLKRNELRG